MERSGISFFATRGLPTKTRTDDYKRIHAPTSILFCSSWSFILFSMNLDFILDFKKTIYFET